MSNKDSTPTNARKRKVFSIFDQNLVKKECKHREGPLRIVSWNVAGLRACVKKKGHSSIAELNADIILLQETKCNEWPPEMTFTGYSFRKLFAAKNKNGYSGVAMLSREEPISVVCTIEDARFDGEGRLIQAEFANFFIVSVYVPNSGQKLVNLKKRSEWEELIRARLKKLDDEKPVLYIGDMNVAHNEIDLKNPASNKNRTAGFTDQEREDFTKLLSLGFVDVYRQRNPDQANAYTFWSYLGNARSRNVGWRIDYFVVSKRIYEKVVDCEIHSNILGSDHCPISMTIDI